VQPECWSQNVDVINAATTPCGSLTLPLEGPLHLPRLIEVFLLLETWI
jgi:hypothetical protein